MNGEEEGLLLLSGKFIVPLASSEESGVRLGVGNGAKHKHPRGGGRESNCAAMIPFCPPAFEFHALAAGCGAGYGMAAA